MDAPANTSVSSGKPIFLHYDQKSLDDAYDQNVWARDRDGAWRRRSAFSEDVRSRIGAPTRLTYGATDIEKLDLYRTQAKDAPVVILVHGGAWRRGNASDHAFAAEQFVVAGSHYVVPDFANVQDVGGDLNVLVGQIRNVIVWTFHEIRRFGGNPDQIYLIGHSSGAHLATAALLTDWASLGLSPGIVRAAFCLSGLYDLKGARLSARSNYVSFTDQVEQDLSAARHIHRIPCPITIAYGSLDSPEFQRMAQEFAKALDDVHKLAGLLVADQMDHFETLECLSDPRTEIGKAALNMVFSNRLHEL
jgi:arylformamidase